MSKRRRTAVIVLAVLVLALLLAPEAIAAAGGGSSGFGGGGGGEGGGGRGFAIYIILQVLLRIALIGHGLGALVLIGLLIAYVLFTRVAPGATGFWQARQSSGPTGHRRTARRDRRVELAAAEAAEEDPAFSPDNLRRAARQLFSSIQSAWDAGDRSRLGELVAPELLTEWERRLGDFDRRGWRNHVQPLGEPKVDLVGINRPGNPAHDHVTVRVEARLRDFVVDRSGNRIKRAGRFTETVRIREFWTLARRGGRWMLTSIEQAAEGAHALSEQLVPTPWSDEQALRDEALLERAVSEATPDVAEIAALNFEGGARAAAMDLSVADGRFAPDVLEVAARRAVAAWAHAVDGDERELRAIADPKVVRELLHPGDPAGRTRLVVRGLRAKRIDVIGLDPAAIPPTMTIDVKLDGRRYLEDRDTAAVVAGSQSRERSFSERWTFALGGDAKQPWRIAALGSPAARGATPAPGARA